MANNNGMNKTTTWFVVGLIVLVTAGVILAAVFSSGSTSSGGQNPPGFTATTAPAITSVDWSRGNQNASVTLVEYGDFECPACAEYQPLMQQAVQNYSSTVRFVFRNFPLTQIHPDAMISSQAAEAAGIQGKYWEMHDLLYAKQSEWVTTPPDQVVSKYFDGYAQSLGLDVNKFNQDVASQQVLNKIQADVAGGNTAAIDHTPTFFVNLKQIPNPTSYADFKSVLDQALGSAAPAVSATVTPGSAAVTATVTSTQK